MTDASPPQHGSADAAQQLSGAAAATGLSLADVAKLTLESDYAAFIASGVDAQVRNEALRKLFHTDPHFKQPDELDVRIDEVVGIEASPLARQYKIQQARALGLLDDDLVDQDGDGTSQTFR